MPTNAVPKNTHLLTSDDKAGPQCTPSPYQHTNSELLTAETKLQVKKNFFIIKPCVPGWLKEVLIHKQIFDLVRPVNFESL